MSRALAAACEAVLGRPMLANQGVGGGSISAAWRVETADGPAFVKETGAAQADWFVAEAEGLEALARCEALRVPDVLGSTANDGRAFLFLSWIDLRRAGSADDARCGEALAALHAIDASRFG